MGIQGTSKDLENLVDGVSLHDVKGAPVVGEVTLAPVYSPDTTGEYSEYPRTIG